MREQSSLGCSLQSMIDPKRIGSVDSNMIELTSSQIDATERAIKSVNRGNKLFRIGGYAGVGKTTLAKSIISEIDGAAVCAFTGKAASVLRSKGIPSAATIHSTIYRYDEARDQFQLKAPRELHDIRYFLLDEASMVATEQWEDLQTFRKPIIAIGDPGQLEPVGDDPRLMHNPDVVLTEIHRQDADSAIIQFATHIRNGGNIKRGIKGDVEIGSRDLFYDSLEWADIMLCGFNRTRVAVNAMQRERIYGKQAIESTIQFGEKIICLKNDRTLGFSNGEIFEVRNITGCHRDVWTCDLMNSDGKMKYDIGITEDAFGVEKPQNTQWVPPGTMLADYAYCVSTHKFQGSEADNVAVCREQCKLWDQVRWDYTSATRAAKKLRFAI
jgi:exodeoxyribonuclease-5